MSAVRKRPTTAHRGKPGLGMWRACDDTINAGSLVDCILDMLQNPRVASFSRESASSIVNGQIGLATCVSCLRSRDLNLAESMESWESGLSTHIYQASRSLLAFRIITKPFLKADSQIGNILECAGLANAICPVENSHEVRLTTTMPL